MIEYKSVVGLFCIILLQNCKVSHFVVTDCSTSGRGVFFCGDV